MRILKLVGAAIGGILAGAIVIMLIEGISSMVHPMPEGLKVDDLEGMKAFVASLPPSAFLFVLLAWSLGLFTAGYVARRIAPLRSMRPALVACAFLLLGAIVTLFSIPHPTWFWFAGIAVCLVFGLIGTVMAAPSEYSVQTTRRIHAPVELVFRTLATIGEFSKAVPGIIKIEFLSDKKYGVGTRFRETRVMHGKEASTELEITELEENRHIRLVSNAGGAIWDTIFTVAQSGDSVEMNMKMDARPNQIAAKIVLPLIMGFVSKAVEQDMDSLKSYCESSRQQTSSS
jgi:carbon monoxide dehydrogenase subunit G